MLQFRLIVSWSVNNCFFIASVVVFLLVAHAGAVARGRVCAVAVGGSRVVVLQCEVADGVGWASQVAGSSKLAGVEASTNSVAGGCVILGYQVAEAVRTTGDDPGEAVGGVAGPTLVMLVRGPVRK